MSNAGNSDPLARLRAADPVEIEELEGDVKPLRSRILDTAITLGEGSARRDARAAAEARIAAAPRRRGFFTRRRLGFSLGFGSLACAGVLAAVIVFSGGSIESVRQGVSPGFAQAAVRVAEANPRFLITAPGWRIVEARSFRPKVGVLVFSDGHRQVRLWWLEADHQRNLSAQPRSTRKFLPTEVLGRRALTMVSNVPWGGKVFTTQFPPEAGIVVSLTGGLPFAPFAGLTEWKALLATLRAVSVERWLGAMPAGVVPPQAMSTEIARMLEGVRTPPGFDASEAVDRRELTNRFQAAKHLTEAVTCGWVESWTAARRSGDAAAAQEAVDAMSGAHRWPVLLRMAHEKGYRGTAGHEWSSSIVTVGRQMAGGRLRRGVQYGDKGEGRVEIGFTLVPGALPPNVLACPSAK